MKAFTAVLNSSQDVSTAMAALAQFVASAFASCGVKRWRVEDSLDAAPMPSEAGELVRMMNRKYSRHFGGLLPISTSQPAGWEGVWRGPLREIRDCFGEIRITPSLSGSSIFIEGPEKMIAEIIKCFSTLRWVEAVVRN